MMLANANYMDYAATMIREAAVLTLLLSLPVLGAALVTGLIVSALQAVMQIQEHTVSFLPKAVAATVAAVLAGPWILGRLMEFARRMFTLL